AGVNALGTRRSASRSSTNDRGSYSHGIPYQSRIAAHSRSAPLTKRGGAEPRYALNWTVSVDPSRTTPRVRSAADVARLFPAREAGCRSGILPLDPRLRRGTPLK